MHIGVQSRTWYDFVRTFVYQAVIKAFLEKNLYRTGKVSPAAPIKTPREQLGAIFDVVQLSRAFLDSKTFVDCIPKYPLEQIQKSYAHYAPSMSIGEFVKENFIVPEFDPAPKAPAVPLKPQVTMEEYITLMWDLLTREADEGNPRSSLLPLPRRFVVPGGRFREIYYWDSYFTMLGLKESKRFDLIEDMVENFAHLIRTYGFIPNGNRTYYLTRSQPPFFALMVELLANEKGDSIYSKYLPEMKTEYEYWMKGAQDKEFKSKVQNASLHVVRMPDGEILNRFYDTGRAPREESFAEDMELSRQVKNPTLFYQNMRAGAESGWDYTSRWFADGKSRESIDILNIVPVDLNSDMALFEEIIGIALEKAGDKFLSSQFHTLAKSRRAAIRKYFWDSKLGWFCDYTLSEGARSPRISLAGMSPLFASAASEAEAEAVSRTLSKLFLRQGGLVSTLVETGEQWDSPNGWAPLQYIAVQGLERYGFSELAREVAKRWYENVLLNFKKTGALLEKYNVENPAGLAGGGEYPLQDGFGWTNGVTLAFLKKYELQ